ncbi:MAG: uroporphyrinogen-III C-methyltransferase [Sphingobacteriales bacterium SCN 48-20]|uniref:uroporphyrinogen-III C-methyltransferase n=1 Tax=Terrimonas ferruginea TaxID=249 RepID=UPI0008684C72|nr:uroporphyrinogen-III C-methyltransferase [Terrimonas ferruginea]MBN8781502.1 uroporphyrinogen-III C-methyltransferase [Terrimonas ferruginea]ODT94851.1 MAG: uroporphyrinogen-III C-methyltransferase [Sphingobacteriales bacterium SCN 48-20]OJW44667.1 MAG: uroporphyrinogen-III C-methyltransferase [Sphingobacteriales bacterium 48-107]
MPFTSSLTDKGKVILAGAGPGDADLITVRLQRCLAQADVIITDRLVNTEIIDLYARKEALVLMTGKQGFHDGSVAQSDINKIIVHHAAAGKTVLRLKGGDVAFFSNVLDELISLEEAGIPFEIIPGITAGSGAAAYAGIPLTARGYAKNVQFITFNPCSQYEEGKWKSFVQPDETLVFYMAAKSLGKLVRSLMANGAAPDMPMAVIEQATTAHQQVHLSTLEDCCDDFSGKRFVSPSLVIVGRVVSLHRRFAWYKGGKPGTVFKELITPTIVQHA